MTKSQQPSFWWVYFDCLRGIVHALPWWTLPLIIQVALGLLAVMESVEEIQRRQARRA